MRNKKEITMDTQTLKAMKVGKCAYTGKYMIRKEHRNVWAVYEMGGDRMTSGTAYDMAVYVNRNPEEAARRRKMIAMATYMQGPLSLDGYSNVN
jgi:hypothetical protein